MLPELGALLQLLRVLNVLELVEKLLGGGEVDKESAKEEC